MTGTTTKETHHGEPGNMVTVRAGIRVRLEPATNLPEDSPIKYWASPFYQSSMVADLVRGIGIGLHAGDVRLD